MKEANHERWKKLLQDVVPPVARAELGRDLWPQMLRRLEQRPAEVPWLDWALAVLLAGSCLLFPQVIPALLYHL